MEGHAPRASALPAQQRRRGACVQEIFYLHPPICTFLWLPATQGCSQEGSQGFSQVHAWLLPHRQAFQQLLLAGDRQLVTTLLQWTLPQPELLAKRAFVGHHLTLPAVRVPWALQQGQWGLVDMGALHSMPPIVRSHPHPRQREMR